MSNQIVIEPKFKIDDEVFFLGNGKIEEGIIVLINYSVFSIGTIKEYIEKKIQGVSYGVEVEISHNEYEVKDIPEDNIFYSKVELAQYLLNKAKQA